MRYISWYRQAFPYTIIIPIDFFFSLDVNDACQSMGGAVCFSVYERNPSLWKGVVFVAPMCKIKNDMVSFR